MQNSYDLVRYPSWPIVNTHPVRISAHAALLGCPFVPFAQCRVLEIGCGDGINLMSMAMNAPEAVFVGIDLAEAPIAHGRALAQSAGLTNVRLEALDVTTLGAEIGTFDYIIAHGVYAWVPEPVRPAIMSLIGATLAPQGLAFISYNVDPGCRIRQILRDLMLSYVHGIDDPSERIKTAHAALNTFIEHWSDTDSFQSALKSEAQDMLKRPAALLFHDELGSFYAPQRLSTVVDAAQAAGLDYLCDTRSREIDEMMAAAEPLDTAAWVQFEQSRDFLEMRRFRQSIFCRAGSAIDRRIHAERLRVLWITGDLALVKNDGQAQNGFMFRTAKEDEFETTDADLAKVLIQLGQAFPAALSSDDILNRHPQIGEAILALTAKNIVELTTAPLPFNMNPGDHACASPLARAQIAQGDHVLASLRHRAIRLNDAGARSFMSLLDGSRPQAALVRDMAADTGMTEEQAAARLPEVLADLARYGLLVA